MEKGNLAKQKVMQLMGLLAEEGRIEDIKKSFCGSGVFAELTFGI